MSLPRWRRLSSTTGVETLQRHQHLGVGQSLPAERIVAGQPEHFADPLDELGGFRFLLFIHGRGQGGKVGRVMYKGTPQLQWIAVPFADAVEVAEHLTAAAEPPATP